MAARNGIKCRTGLVIAMVLTLILGIAALSFAAWGGHGPGGYLHDGGYGGHRAAGYAHDNGYGHNGGCRGAGYMKGALQKNY